MPAPTMELTKLLMAPPIELLVVGSGMSLSVRLGGALVGRAFVVPTASVCEALLVPCSVIRAKSVVEEDDMVICSLSLDLWLENSMKSTRHRLTKNVQLEVYCNIS